MKAVMKSLKVLAVVALAFSAVQFPADRAQAATCTDDCYAARDACFQQCGSNSTCITNCRRAFFQCLSNC